MNTKIVTMILFFGIILFAVLFILNFVNRLLFYKNKVQDKFSSIKVLIDERIEIIKKIVEFLKVNCPHEDNIIRQLENQITNFQNTEDINELLNEIYKSRPILKNATNLESTYLFLQNKDEYQEFKKSIQTNDGKIAFSASVYNEVVDNYNTFRKTKFISTLSKILKFPEFFHYE